MQANRESFPFIVRQDICVRGIQTTQQTPGLILTSHGLPGDIYHGRLRPVSHKLDDIDEIFALHAEHLKAILLRKFGELDMFGRFSAVVFQFHQILRHTRYFFQQNLLFRFKGEITLFNC